MAIIKQKQFENGTVGEYWKIISDQIITLYYPTLNKNYTCVLGLFIDKEARLDEKKPLETIGFDFDVTDIDLSKYTDLRELGYEKIIESKIEERVISTDIDGNEEVEQIEKNWFADSVSDIGQTK